MKNFLKDQNEQKCHKSTNTNYQWAHGMMLNLINHQENVKQNTE